MTYSPEFEAFWGAYPKREPNPKGIAFRAWQKVLKAQAVTAEDLIRAAANFAAECARLKTEQKFIVHARTFLSQERWTDYLPRPEVTGAELNDLPELFHRLRVRRPDLSRAAWVSWFEKLRFDVSPTRTIITAPSAFHVNRVATDWGHDLAAILGPIHWQVAK